jgi:hypothetical protein
MSVSGSSQYLSVIIGHKTMGGAQQQVEKKQDVRLAFSSHGQIRFPVPLCVPAVCMQAAAKIYRRMQE